MATSLIDAITPVAHAGPLYHYTTIEGLLGIVEKSSLWATDIRYLNDHGEFELAIQLIDQLIEELPKGDIDGFDPRAWWDPDYDWLRDLETYVVSFSEDGDLLSQWRSYAAAGTGVALGFAEHVLNRVEVSGATLYPARCFYGESDHRRIAQLVIDEWLEASKVLASGEVDPDDDLDSAFHHFLGQVAMVAACCKHSGFAEERERRLVVHAHPDDSRPQPIFRVGKYSPIPYLKLKIPDLNEVITDVIVGPTAHQALAPRAINALMTKHGLDGLTARPSNTSFRDW